MLASSISAGRLLLIGLVLLLPSLPLRAAHKSIFVAGGLFNEQVASLRNSGFDTAVLWSLHVNGSAELVLNNDILINSNGDYVYGQWARNNCALLKQAPTSITRIEFSVGSAGATDFENIENWVNHTGTGGGTGPGSVLRQNFQALRDNFPQVDAINFDDESNYDLPSTTEFSLMLADLGYKITFAPFSRRTSFWGPLHDAIEAAQPGTVDHVYLQCYAGGSFNNPATWNSSFGSLNVEPGLWAGSASTSGRRDPSEMESDMNAWRTSADIPGGFIWRHFYTTEGGHSVQDYAAAIDGNYTSEFDSTTYYKFINRFSGKALAVLDENLAGTLADGTANGAEVAQYEFNINDDRFFWSIEDLGNGHRSVINKYSGKALAVFSQHLDGVTPIVRTENFADIAQWEYLGDHWYQWRITEAGTGYKLINRHSAKAMAVFSLDTGGSSIGRAENGADIAQYSYDGSSWYHWDIIEITNLRISSITTTSSVLTLNIDGAKPMSVVTIESSPSMAPETWEEAGTAPVDSDGEALFEQALPTDTKRFYRVTDTPSSS